ncbi:MAG: hypothetical protein HMLKMBBP_02770 [Planctomycetes bacterium]|nr:hypothetical protein [Planctomycetota bacterium]
MRLQRYLLRELLLSFLLIALIVTALFFAAAMLSFLRQYSELSLGSVLRAAPYILPLSFPVTLPLSFLVACLLTFGRYADDNEFLAHQMAGIHPWHAAAPALMVAVLIAAGTMKLNTDVIPFATLAKKEVARSEVREVLRKIDDPSRTAIRCEEFEMSWTGRGPQGLRDVVISWEQAPEDGEKDAKPVRRTARAAHARVDVARIDDGLFVLDLDDFEMQVPDDGGGPGRRLVEARRQLALSVDQLTGEPESMKLKGVDELSSAQILYQVRRGVDRQGADVVDYRRRLLTDFWKRIAVALSPIAFAVVGAGLGLAGGRGSRMAALLTAIVVALVLYYPILLGGAALSKKGTLPPPLAMNLANLFVLSFGTWRLGKVFR